MFCTLETGNLPIIYFKGGNGFMDGAGTAAKFNGALALAVDPVTGISTVSN